jgi:hypothetical protein
LPQLCASIKWRPTERDKGGKREKDREIERERMGDDVATTIITTACMLKACSHAALPGPQRKKGKDNFSSLGA